jgi:hypothetical protein
MYTSCDFVLYSDCPVEHWMSTRRYSTKLQLVLLWSTEMSTTNPLLQQLTACESAIRTSVTGRSILVPTAYGEPPISLESFWDLFCLPNALIFNTMRCYDWTAVKAKYLCLVNFVVEEVAAKGCRDGMRKRAWMSTKLAMGTRLL